MAIRLLTTRDDRLASEVAHQLEAENKRRKAIDEKTLNEALEQIEEKINDDDSAIVLASEGWHQGVIGIVASRLVERLCRRRI